MINKSSEIDNQKREQNYFITWVPVLPSNASTALSKEAITALSPPHSMNLIAAKTFGPILHIRVSKMSKPDFEVIWRRILQHEGETFRTKTGLEFKYRIVGNEVVPDRTGYPLHKSNFEKAYELVPFDGPGVINQSVRGPAYVWAILHDPRIRGDNY